MMEPVGIEEMAREQSIELEHPDLMEIREGIRQQLIESLAVLTDDEVEAAAYHELYAERIDPEAFDTAINAISESVSSAAESLNSALNFIEESSRRIEALEAQHKAGIS